MSIPILTLFNNKGGVGKTSLIYHISWIFSRLNKKVLAADLDPQANLTAAFLMEDKIDKIWNTAQNGATIYQCVKPLTSVSDLLRATLQPLSENLFLLAGDVALSSFEDKLAAEWAETTNSTNFYKPLQILCAFRHVLQTAAQKRG